MNADIIKAIKLLPDDYIVDGVAIGRYQHSRPYLYSILALHPEKITLIFIENAAKWEPLEERHYL